MFTGTCDFTWTGGFTTVLGSADNKDWKWNLTDTVGPLIYSAWGAYDPDNGSGDQDALVLLGLFGYNYHYADAPSNRTIESYNYCFLCEMAL